MRFESICLKSLKELLTAEAQRRNIFIAFAETPKAINLQTFPAKNGIFDRQLVSLAPESQVPNRAEFFFFCRRLSGKRK
jgi:hypothetical protein